MKQLSLAMILFFGLGQCLAEGLDNQVQGKIKEQVNAVFPSIIVDTVESSPISGVYQLTAGSLILYASHDGRYLFTGDVLDLQKVEDHNLTEVLRREARANILKKIKSQEMIIYQPQQVKAIVTVFTDSDCGYCKELHQDINKLNNLGVEVRYLAFPRHGTGSSTYTKMESVWCSKDRKEAMELLMHNQEVKPMICDTTVEDQLVLGRKMGISGTPTLIFADGTIWGGYLSADKLAKKAIKHNGVKE